MKRNTLHPRTKAINDKQKAYAKLARFDALTWLAATFPKAFDNTHAIQPLKIGIMHDLLEHAEQAAAAGISKSKLRQAVVVFTRRIDYLASLKAREARVDLNGRPVAEVSIEEAECAALKIKRRVEKSAKNARKMLAAKSTHSTANKPRAFTSTPSISNEPELRSPFSVQPASTSPATRTSAVVVKRKAARAFDPSAVARLKEKLGLAQKKDEAQSVAE